MTITLRGGEILGNIAHEIARLETLAADLYRLGSGVMRDPAELASAPLLNQYARATRQVPCLVGDWNRPGSPGDKPGPGCLVGDEAGVAGPVGSGRAGETR